MGLTLKKDNLFSFLYLHVLDNLMNNTVIKTSFPLIIGGLLLRQESNRISFLYFLNKVRIVDAAKMALGVH